MRRKSLEIIAVVVFMVCLIITPAWAVPGVINYQGKLTNTSDCVLTGDYQIHFSLYCAETGGTASWGEEQSVSVDQGIFSVPLGKVTPLPVSLFDGDNLYLEMAIQNPETGVPEILSPRQRLTSTAYAMKADHAATAVTAVTAATAATADTAVTAANAGHAVSADSATNATKADTAIKAENATSATNADHAIAADNANSATNAGYASTAGNADTVDGKHASELGGGGDGYSLDAADGTPTDAVYVDNEGKVGIGTTSPKGHLDVKDGLAHALINGSNIQFDSSSYPSGRYYYIASTYTEGGYQMGGAFAVRDHTAGEYRWVISPSGNVGIGTVSPSYRLHVAGDAMANHWYTSSDSRLKENITPLTNAIEKVSALRGIYFNLKGEPASKREVGVIAQEVEAVLPEVVSEDAQSYKSVDYSKLTPLLIEAVKGQQAQIEALKAENEAAVRELRAQDEARQAQIEVLKALVCQDHPEAQVCQ